MPRQPESLPIADTASSEPDQTLFWEGLIDERRAAEFLSLSVRTLQGFRHRGGGAVFYRISSRCIRYRRSDLRAWVEARMRSSTSDPGREGA